MLAQILLDVLILSLTSIIEGLIVTTWRSSMRRGMSFGFPIVSRFWEFLVTQLGTIQPFEYILILKQVTDIVYRVINGGQHDAVVFPGASKTGNRSRIELFLIMPRSQIFWAPGYLYITANVEAFIEFISNLELLLQVLDIDLLDSFTIAKHPIIIKSRLFSQVDVLLDKDVDVPPIVIELRRMRSYILINIYLG